MGDGGNHHAVLEAIVIRLRRLGRLRRRRWRAGGHHVQQIAEPRCPLEAVRQVDEQPRAVCQQRFDLRSGIYPDVVDAGACPLQFGQAGVQLIDLVQVLAEFGHRRGDDRPATCDHVQLALHLVRFQVRVNAEEVRFHQQLHLRWTGRAEEFEELFQDDHHCPDDGYHLGERGGDPSNIGQ